MLKRRDMGNPKATADAPWPRRTRACIPSTSAMSPCPPASLSSRSSPWQNPSGSRRCSGTPSINSPPSRNEGGRAACPLRWPWRGPYCSFCAQPKDGRSVVPSAGTAFGDAERWEGLGLPSVPETSCLLGTGRRWWWFHVHRNLLWPVLRWPRPRNWWYALKWVLGSDPASLADDECWCYSPGPSAARKGKMAWHVCIWFEGNGRPGVGTVLPVTGTGKLFLFSIVLGDFVQMCYLVSSESTQLPNGS